ncbi:MAG: aldo/keto reductase [Spirochaetaceae bacterium]
MDTSNYATDSLSSTTTLNNGVRMPWLGLGVFQADSGGAAEAAVLKAIETGYRHIDTASFYENEGDVGRAVRSSGIPRDEIFVTSKLWNTDRDYESGLKAFDRTMKALRLDYLDLYLIHWPGTDSKTRRNAWKALEKLYDEKRVRAIGVSNFHEHHIEDILTIANTVPAVNQVEFHHRLQQPRLRSYCASVGIQFEAWSPLMRGRDLDNEVLVEISEAHGKTAAQVVLRWDLQHGVVTIPKSVHENRIRENADVFDFTLSSEEMARIDSLDTESRIGPHPDTVQ